MTEDQATVTDELREKVKSKMEVAKFFAGFISLLIGILLRDGLLTSVWLRAGIVFLVFSLGFCVAAMFMYDHLLWPKKYWTEEISFQKRLGREMLRAWTWLLVPAVGFFAFGLLLVLVHKLDLAHLWTSREATSDLVLAILLVAAVALPTWFGIMRWPQGRKRLEEVSDE